MRNSEAVSRDYTKCKTVTPEESLVNEGNHEVISRVYSKIVNKTAKLFLGITRSVKPLLRRSH